MIRQKSSWIIGVFLSATCLSVNSALAIDVSVSSEFVVEQLPANTAGGMSYLPDGDILAVSSDFIDGPKLFRVDANGDGIPAGGEKVLMQFDSSVFANFVRVSPNGKFALVGLSGGSSDVLKVDLGDDSISVAFSEIGNYDLTFVDNGHAYLSSNPGGFDPMVPNRISFVDLTSTPSVKTVAEIPSTPSGPIATNSANDLYYIEGTFDFPPPAGSSHLRKFSATALQAALASSAILGANDSEIDVPLDGGYNMAFHDLAGKGGELFISTIGDRILRFVEGGTETEVFLTATDPQNVVSPPALTALSFFEPLGRFDTSGPAQSILGIAVATNFFSEFSLLQVRPTTFDADGDNVIDSADECPLDPSKSSKGVCGCGVSEIDSNNDQVIDCGTARDFSSSLLPQFGQVTVSKHSVKLGLEKFLTKNATYKIELTKLGKKKRTKVYSSKTASLRIKNLATGNYKVRFSLLKKTKKKTLQSKNSLAERFSIQ